VAPRPAPSLLVDHTVRSGQSILYPEGDVVVVGSVGSGAEVIAGGSIHVYGALRGRAIAGSMGNPQARIFCRKLEAELLAIDGLYHMADDTEPQLRGRPVQVWLSGETMMFSALD
jgi:septum site-determining protein MinC